MNCHDARQWIPALTGGPIGLTEWALVEAHLRQCPECRKTVTGQGQAASARGAAPTLGALRTWVRLLLAALVAAGTRVMARLGQAVRLAVGGVTHLCGQLLGVAWTALTLATRAAIGLGEAFRLAVVDLAHLGSWLGTQLLRLLAIAVRLGAWAITGLFAISRAAIAGLASASRGAISGLAWASGAAATGLVSVCRAAIALASASRAATSGLASASRAATTGLVSTSRLATTGLASASRGAMGVVSASCAGIASLARPGIRVRSLGRLPLRLAAHAGAGARAAISLATARARDVRTRLAGSFSIPLMTVARVVGSGLVAALALYVLLERPVPGPATIADSRDESTSTGHTWQVAIKPPAVHVIGRLSVKDRTATERDLAALLVQTGGTQLGRRQDVRTTVVDAVVPQSVYQEFTHGLSRIGSWQIEAERSPLPKGVHVSIRVGE